MKILFVTLSNFNSIDDRGIYNDLFREFISCGNELYVVSPTERRNKQKTRIIDINETSKILKIKILNITKTNLLEKGISTITIDGKFKKKIKKYFKGIKFDLILYSTPPVTFAKTISYFKKRDKAITYLMLKDIFPQNAVDLGMIKKGGFIYKYFRKKEIKLYKNSDYIGCMSQANCDYVVNHNSYIDSSIVHVSPNCLNPMFSTNKTKEEIREEYKIPKEKKVFIYGGNLGRPQGIDFMNKCLDNCKEIQNAFFVICGKGTEYGKIGKYIEEKNINNVLLINGLSKEKYDELAYSCDIGLIFLDYRFTIPNYPSRLLSYLDVEIPVLACVDKVTDIGKFIVDNKIGWECRSNDENSFKDLIIKISKEETIKIEGKKLMEEFYSPKRQKELIEEKIAEKRK